MMGRLPPCFLHQANRRAKIASPARPLGRRKTPVYRLTSSEPMGSDFQRQESEFQRHKSSQVGTRKTRRKRHMRLWWLRRLGLGCHYQTSPSKA
jgi:hypothetical protein